MKNYFNYIFIVVLLSCNSMDQPDLQVDDPLDIQSNLLNGTWILKDETSAVRDGSVVSDFKNITLTFANSSKSGGNYSTTNSIDADVIKGKL